MKKYRLVLGSFICALSLTLIQCGSSSKKSSTTNTTPDPEPEFTAVLYLADEDVDGQFELYITQEEGDPIEVISSLPATASVLAYKITSDGSKVVFVADIDTDDVFELYVANVEAGSSATKLNDTLVSGGNVLGTIELSSDDSTVVYLADQTTDTANEIYSVPVAGGTVNTVNDALAAGREVTSFAISPDNTQVVYIADDAANDRYDVLSAPIAGGGATNLSGVSVGYDALDFEITSDSATVVYTRTILSGIFTQTELFSRPIDGSTAAVHLDEDSVGVYDDDVFAFDVSADGLNVAYISDHETDGVQEVYVVATSGVGGSTKLNAAMPTNGDAMSLVMSPNNTHLLFFGDAETNGVNELFYVPIDDSADPSKVNPDLDTNENVFSLGTFNSDGSAIYYIADQDTDEIQELYKVSSSSLQSSSKVNSSLATDGDVNSFTLFNSAIYYLADQEADGVLELYIVELDALGSSDKVNGTLVTDGDVIGFGASGSSI
ncbi:MAG: hypothetical protein KDD52_07690 [Bdellovibrionales bacterium]|nr:hypothetical protein [Bdellovibrionales bacterium]